MTSPDEAAIRDHIESRWREARTGGLSLASAFSDAFTEAMAAAHGLWAVDALRPSEQERYDGLLSVVCTEVQYRAQTLLLDAMVEAMTRFAAEHPEAPPAR